MCVRQILERGPFWPHPSVSSLKNEEKVGKLQTFDLSFFIGKSYFIDDGSRKFSNISTNFKHFHSASWCYRNNCSMGIYVGVFLQKWSGIIQNSEYDFRFSCLKQYKVTFTPRNVAHLFIAYELDTWLRDLNSGFTLKDCLFEAVKLTKNADPDRCLILDMILDRSLLSLSNFGCDKNAIFTPKDILVLSEYLAQR